MNGKTRLKANRKFPQDIGNELTLIGKLDRRKATEVFADDGLSRDRKMWNIFAKNLQNLLTTEYRDTGQGNVHTRLTEGINKMKNGVFWDVTPCGSC
jgi:hypothetical protein